MGNTLWKAIEQRFISVDEGLRKFSYFLKLRIGSIELEEEEYREALDWSVKNGATYYDSTYVRSSRKAGATLLTADDILYEKACKEISALHLKDY